MKNSIIFRFSVLLAGFVFQVTGYAQTAIEEVIVTATKRDTSVMDVAASVTAFTGEALNTLEIEGVNDLNINVPNINNGTWNGQVFFTIRGVGFGQTHGSADPAVAQHIDGIFLPRTSSLRGAYYDLGSLEVLRGPQGTLYGRNTTGGSVNLVTNKPTEEFEGQLSALYGDYDRVQLSGRVSGPLSDNLQGRVSFLYDERDAYTENLAPGFRDPDDEEIMSVRGALSFQPTGAFTIDVSVHYEEWEGGNLFDNLTPPSDVLYPIYTGARFSTKAHEAYADVNADDTRDDLIVGLNIEWALSDNVTLLSKTGYIETDWDQFSDADGTDAPVTYYSTGTDSKTWSQELNLRASLMDDRLDVLAGFYYYDDDLDWRNMGSAAFIDDLIGLPLGTLFYQTTFDQDTESIAGYLDATYNVTEALRLYGGVRYTDETKDVVQQFRFGFFPGSCGFGLGTPPSTDSQTYSDTSFRVGGQYHLSENSMVYAQYSTGFRSGGFDSSSCNDPFDQESNDAWEIGFKGSFADGRVVLRSSAFLYDYTDLQIASLNGFQIDVLNVKGADIWGIELETQFLVTDRLQLAVNYGYLDTEYGDHIDCDVLLFPGNCSAATIIAGTAVFEDVSGNRLNRAPEHTLGIIANYLWPLNNGGEVAFTGQYTYTDDVYYRTFNTALDKQDAYSIGNVFVSYKPSGGSKLTLKGFVKNIGDKKYVGHISGNGSTSFNRQTGAWNPPRTWGIQAIWDF
ncbi:MAG: TonB-dependent receptor [Gammaproteobacteria bacterium]|nr:TonB-dependent receptor [Gammaproteobacteria bacterium]